MRRIYKKPEIILVEAQNQFSLMATSITPEGTIRKDEGDPTTSGLPTNVEESGSEGDPYGEHGQDGNTTRSKTGMIWDEW